MYSLLAVPGIGRLSPWFLWRLASWCSGAGVNADCILGMMHIESGMKPDAVHPDSGASGLIQVMPSMASHYGASIDEIRGMSAEEQLERIILKRRWPKVTDCGVVYMANFLPAYAYEPDDTVIGRKGGTDTIKGGLSTGAIYKGNYGFDVDKDGIFTVGDVKNFMRGKMTAWAEKYGRIEISDAEPERPAIGSGGSIGGGWLLGLGAAGALALLLRRLSR